MIIYRNLNRFKKNFQKFLFPVSLIESNSPIKMNPSQILINGVKIYSLTNTGKSINSNLSSNKLFKYGIYQNLIQKINLKIFLIL